MESSVNAEGTPCRSVDDAATRAFVCDEARNPYVAHLVWHIGKQSLQLDHSARDARYVSVSVRLLTNCVSVCPMELTTYC